MTSNGASKSCGPPNQALPASHPDQTASPAPRGTGRRWSERMFGWAVGSRPGLRRTRRLSEETAAASSAGRTDNAGERAITGSVCVEAPPFAATLPASYCLCPFFGRFSYPTPHWPRQSQLYPPPTLAIRCTKTLSLVAIKQQGSRGFLGWRVLACQWIRRFGTIGSTSRLPREKVSDGRRKRFFCRLPT